MRTAKVDLVNGSRNQQSHCTLAESSLTGLSRQRLAIHGEQEVLELIGTIGKLLRLVASTTSQTSNPVRWIILLLWALDTFGAVGNAFTSGGT